MSDTTLSDQEENLGSEEQSQVGDNASSFPPEASVNTVTPPPLPHKGSPDRLAEDLGSGRKFGAVIYIQNKYDGKITHKTSNFYLQQFAIGLRERSQVLETFGAANVSFFGPQAKVYNFGGTALDWGSQNTNTYEYFHASSLIHMYENELRGSKLVQNDQIAVLRILNHTVFGYPLQMNISYDQAGDKLATFSLAFLVTKHLLTLPGLISDNQLESLYSATQVTSLTDAEGAYVANITSVVESCLAALSVDKSETDYYSSVASQNSLSHKNYQQMLTLVENTKTIESNFKALSATLKATFVAAEDDVSPFIAQTFGPSEEKIEEWFTTLLGHIDKTNLKNDEVELQHFRSKCAQIQNFVDSLQSLMWAIQG